MSSVNFMIAPQATKFYDHATAGFYNNEPNRPPRRLRRHPGITTTSRPSAYRQPRSGKDSNTSKVSLSLIFALSSASRPRFCPTGIHQHHGLSDLGCFTLRDFSIDLTSVESASRLIARHGEFVSSACST